MTITRQDAWTEEEDTLLAETVIRHIREGSTQLAAFEEIGAALFRTPAACGFRWNSYVRKKMKDAIELAKVQRKEWKQEKVNRGYYPAKEYENRAPYSPFNEKVYSDDKEFQKVIQYIEYLYQKSKETPSSQEEVEQQLLQKYEDLQLKYQKLQREFVSITSVLERAVSLYKQEDHSS